jgi:hypothetical protein
MSALLQKKERILPKLFNLDSPATGKKFAYCYSSQAFSVPIGSPMAFLLPG